jgi:hypothetical protein
MEQTDFLEQKIFVDLENQNSGFDKPDVHYFSEEDFEKVIERAEHFGLSIYLIKPAKDGEIQKEILHTDLKKKATDPNWYKKTLKTLGNQQPDLLYSATYKVSAKLLAK